MKIYIYIGSNNFQERKMHICKQLSHIVKEIEMCQSCHVCIAMLYTVIAYASTC